MKDLELLDNDGAANLLRIRPNTLEIWRLKGFGPPFIKMGVQKQSPVRYVKSVVEEWLSERLYASTSAYGATTTHKPNISPP